MINLANKGSKEKADNVVTFCGLEYLLTNTEAEQLQVIVEDIINCRSKGGIVKASQTTYQTGTKGSNSGSSNSGSKGFWDKPYEGKGFKCKFEVEKLTDVDGVVFYAISRKCGWTKQEKGCANAYIKAIKGIETHKVQFTKEDGTLYTPDCWGFKTEATAKKHLKDLPVRITQFMMQMWLASKGAELPKKELGEEEA